MDTRWAFLSAFGMWFEVEYPEIYREIEPATSDGLPGLEADPADMLVVLQYVDEFVAQSDVYPLDGQS